MTDNECWVTYPEILATDMKASVCATMRWKAGLRRCAVRRVSAITLRDKTLGGSPLVLLRFLLVPPLRLGKRN